jgi:hypothetical protein
VPFLAAVEWRDALLADVLAVNQPELSGVKARCRAGVAEASSWLWLVYEVQGLGVEEASLGDASGGDAACAWLRAVSFSVHRSELAAMARSVVVGKGTGQRFGTSRKFLCRSEAVLFAARRSHPVLHGGNGAPATGYLLFKETRSLASVGGGESSWQCVTVEGGEQHVAQVRHRARVYLRASSCASVCDPRCSNLGWLALAAQ